MSAIASQITSLTIVFTQSFIQTQIKENIKARRHWPLCGEFTGDRWILRTNGQLRRKCFHLMTSSWKPPWYLCQLTRSAVMFSWLMRLFNHCHRCETIQSHGLTHWGRDKMAAIFQTAFSNAFSWMKIYKFWLRFHWNFFPRVQIITFHHCFR